ncbi:MAG: ribonuclease J [Firmicutes bacterium]|nr:ribonuclease J [Bacillota bacterium]
MEEKKPEQKQEQKQQRPANQNNGQNGQPRNRELGQRTAGAKNLRIVFLGGVGEIGKNMTALEYGDDIIVIDAGMGFPTIDMPGIDLVVQDITYLVKNKHRVRGYVITHAHEDHIGAVPYVLNEVPAPIFGSRMSLAMIDNKLREHPGIKVKATSVRPRSVVQIGKFGVEFVHVNHSLSGCFAISVTTPVGVVFHTGDFKIDFTPVDGNVIDLARIAEIGKRGVALLLAESTNVERKGFTMSETVVGKRIGEIFDRNTDKRIFVATFSSNIHRVQQLLDLAEKHKRKVAFSGRSMINVSDTAIKIGEMTAKKDLIIPIDQVGNYADKEILIILTGSQGEPSSALVRMSTGDFNKIHLGTNDTVILSSSPIPGNESSVNKVVNNLIKRGVDVVYQSLAEVHVSGHACEEELKIIHSLLKPRFFIPVHGEYKHLKSHVELAQRLGMPERHTAIAEIGDVWELSVNSLKRVAQVPAGERLIDGKGSGTMDSNVLRDRTILAEEGICIIGIGFDRETGVVTSGPEITTRGLLYIEEMEQIIPELRQTILDAAAKHNLSGDDATTIRNTIRRDVQNFFQNERKRRPIVVTMLIGN